MDKNLVEKLLSLDENSFLDFKSMIDLESKRGKAKFLVEVLGLANSIEKPAYLVLGVEDKTKKATGISKEITEERIQKVIADNCRPHLKCKFEYVAYKRKRIGILIILGRNRPYFLKKEIGFQDENGKQRLYSEKSVFTRRGSTGDIAAIDEIIDMVLEQQESETPSGSFEEIREEIGGVSSNLYHVNNSINRLIERKDRDRVVEYIFVGIVAGLVVGALQVVGLDWFFATYGIMLSAFWVSILASALKIIRFGWLRSVIIGLIISVAFIALSNLSDKYIIQILASPRFSPYLVPIWAGVKGMVGGIIAAFLGRGEYEYD